MEEPLIRIINKQKDELRCLLRNAGRRRNAVLVDTCLLSQVRDVLFAGMKMVLYALLVMHFKANIHIVKRAENC